MKTIITNMYLAGIVMILAACAPKNGENGSQGPQGIAGPPGQPCTMVIIEAGVIITCGDDRAFIKGVTEHAHDEE